MGRAAPASARPGAMTARRRQDFVDALDPIRRRYQKRPVEREWKLAALPIAGTTAVIADVFNSVSARPIIEHYSAEALETPVAAFSYFGVGEHYVPEDTHQSIHASADLFASYLPLAETHAVIPIGASGGGVVALLGTAVWIRTGTLPLAALARCVPRIVLVAPGISPTPTLYDRYHERFPDEEPYAVRQLCDVGSPEWLETQKVLAEAFALVRWAGIPVHVIHWVDDILTPYPWHPSIQAVAERAVTPTGLAPSDLRLLRRNHPQFEKEAARAHVAFCSHAQTIALVRRLLRAGDALGS